MGNSNLLFESIFQRKLSVADTREFLTKITNEHPYFSPAQFFLLLETEKGTTAYQEQAAKTSILFNNPYWLQFQLQEGQESDSEISNGAGTVNDKPELTENQESVARSTMEPNKIPGNLEAGKIDHQEKEIIAVSEEFPINEEPLPSQPQETVIDFNAEKETDQFIDETDLQTSGAPAKLTPGNNIGPVIGENIISGQENNVDGIIEENETEQVLNEDTVLPQPENEKEEDIIKEKEIPAAKTENGDSNIPGNEEEIIDTLHSGHFNNENSPLVNETETEEDPVTEQEIEPLNFKLNIDTTDTTEENITFEPLHTSDYFASLGIKLSSEIMPSDKLGKQLKSFTEWLKTMKKVHNDQLPPLSSQADMSIQKLAEQSNKEDVVLTEAMADVLLRQGKLDKALEVYKKLSLLNPSKSAYFAAKIDQLKEH